MKLQSRTMLIATTILLSSMMVHAQDAGIIINANESTQNVQSAKRVLKLEKQQEFANEISKMKDVIIHSTDYSNPNSSSYGTIYTQVDVNKAMRLKMLIEMLNTSATLDNKTINDMNLYRITDQTPLDRPTYWKNLENMNLEALSVLGGSDFVKNVLQVYEKANTSAQNMELIESAQLDAMAKALDVSIDQISFEKVEKVVTKSHTDVKWNVNAKQYVAVTVPDAYQAVTVNLSGMPKASTEYISRIGAVQNEIVKSLQILMNRIANKNIQTETLLKSVNRLIPAINRTIINGAKLSQLTGKSKRALIQLIRDAQKVVTRGIESKVDSKSFEAEKTSAFDKVERSFKLSNGKLEVRGQLVEKEARTEDSKEAKEAKEMKAVRKTVEIMKRK